MCVGGRNVFLNPFSEKKIKCVEEEEEGRLFQWAGAMQIQAVSQGFSFSLFLPLSLSFPLFLSHPSIYQEQPADAAAGLCGLPSPACHLPPAVNVTYSWFESDEMWQDEATGESLINLWFPGDGGGRAEPQEGEKSSLAEELWLDIKKASGLAWCCLFIKRRGECGLFSGKACSVTVCLPQIGN